MDLNRRQQSPHPPSSHKHLPAPPTDLHYLVLRRSFFLLFLSLCLFILAFRFLRVLLIHTAQDCRPSPTSLSSSSAASVTPPPSSSDPGDSSHGHLQDSDDLGACPNPRGTRASSREPAETIDAENGDAIAAARRGSAAASASARERAPVVPHREIDSRYAKSLAVAASVGATAAAAARYGKARYCDQRGRSAAAATAADPLTTLTGKQSDISLPFSL